ncbi:hypothetical protein KJ780_01020 [Candidatus Micrarchaeota archaeon]|nr:hypothetical protein [Candidatus Micrarchaeota archaeon]
MARAFIFSIDAFVALTVMLIMLHSLILISAIPSTYYSGLTQASYLARDTLAMLSNTDASQVIGPAHQSNLLAYVINQDRAQVYRLRVGSLIPQQYGYSMDMWNVSGNDWIELYNTASDNSPDNGHNKFFHKLKVSSQRLYMGYVSSERDSGEPIYSYLTCSGAQIPCDAPPLLYEAGNASLSIVRLTVYR